MQRLETDLALDSLGRVELLSLIEAELEVYVDEPQVGPETTLRELETLVLSGSWVPQLSFPQWGRRLWCRVLRVGLQWCLVFPLMHLCYKIEIRGRDELGGLPGPVLFAANHNVKMDNPLIIMALPFSWRWNLAIAAAADDIFGHRVRRIGAPLLGNGFPFSREGAIRPSLQHLGLLMDQGWSVLIYPEGYNTYGEMDSFKPGAGMVAVVTRSRIVPLRVKLHRGGVFDRKSRFCRGRVEIRFGEALDLPVGVDYQRVPQQLEAAVRAL